MKIKPRPSKKKRVFRLHGEEFELERPAMRFPQLNKHFKTLSRYDASTGTSHRGSS